MPEPPYAGSIVAPRKPSSAMRPIRCSGKTPLASASRAKTATSLTANVRASDWMRRCSSVSSKSIGASSFRSYDGEALDLNQRVVLKESCHLKERHRGIVAPEIAAEQLAQWL